MQDDVLLEFYVLAGHWTGLINKRKLSPPFGTYHNPADVPWGIYPARRIKVIKLRTIRRLSPVCEAHSALMNGWGTPQTGDKAVR